MITILILYSFGPTKFASKVKHKLISGSHNVSITGNTVNRRQSDVNAENHESPTLKLTPLLGYCQLHKKCQEFSHFSLSKQKTGMTKIINEH